MSARIADERGFSLVEMVVAIGLVTAVIAVMGPLLTSSMESGRVVSNESRALDELRLAVARIDRELRSADCITVPAAGTSGPSLTFRTLEDPAGPYVVAYAVDGSGRLQRTVDGDTKYLGEGLVMTNEEFARATNPGQRDSVQIELNVSLEDGNNPRVVSTVVAGRNAWSQC